MGQLWEFFVFITDESEKHKAFFIERVKCGFISEGFTLDETKVKIPSWIKQTFK